MATASNFEIARHVQSAFLPKTCRSCKGICLAAKHVMSEGIGGDLYDFVPGPGGVYSLVIGDVVGHDLLSALVMSLIFGAVHTVGPRTDSPADVVGLVNDLLCEMNEQIRSPVLMCSLFYGTVDPAQRRMIYTNAGHPSPLIWSRNQHMDQLAPTCPVLGVSRQTKLSNTSLSLEDIDRMLLYTDGVTEACDQTDHVFGTDGIVNTLSSCEKHSPEASLNRLFEKILTWVNGVPKDDMTAILADFTNSQDPSHKHSGL